MRFVHPDNATKMAKLKFNTRGKPDNYTRAICTKGELSIQVRHSLRVATKHDDRWQRWSANVVDGCGGHRRL